MKNKYDDLENKIFEFTENDKNVPSYIDKAINDAIYKKKTNYDIIYKFKRIAIIILSLGVITSGVVFAKDIINYFYFIFNNSTSGIDSAIKNGYVQNVDTDFVYNNGVGIKINSLVIDNNILDISLAFKLNELKNVDNIIISEFDIYNETDKLVSVYNDEKNNRIIKNIENKIQFIEMSNDIKLINGIYYMSVLFRIDKLNDLKNLKLDFSQIEIYYKAELINIIDGKWNFSVNIDNKMINREKIEYNMSYDDSIMKVSNVVNETNFVIDIYFVDNFDLLMISDINSIILEDEDGKKVDIIVASYYEKEKSVHLEIDNGKYNLPNYLILKIKYDFEKEAIVKFYR